MRETLTNLKSQISSQPIVGKGISSIRDLLQKVIFEQTFFNLLTAAKLKYIFNGASDCFAANNVIGLANFSRLTLEHTATYAYIIGLHLISLWLPTGIAGILGDGDWLTLIKRA